VEDTVPSLTEMTVMSVNPEAGGETQITKDQVMIGGVIDMMITETMIVQRETVKEGTVTDLKMATIQMVTMESMIIGMTSVMKGRARPSCCAAFLSPSQKAIFEK
jgi:hypothetical protein